jgi:hypothetical protein
MCRKDVLTFCASEQSTCLPFIDIDHPEDEEAIKEKIKRS